VKNLTLQHHTFNREICLIIISSFMLSNNPSVPRMMMSPSWTVNDVVSADSGLSIKRHTAHLSLTLSVRLSNHRLSFTAIRQLNLG